MAAASVTYGSLVNAYTAYKKNEQLAEWRLGHEPFLRLLGQVEGKTILDFGCGPANFSSLLSECGARVIGFDADREVSEAAQVMDPRGSYHHYRGLLAEQVQGEKIDVIIATFSICLIPDRELRYILRDMRQILSPGSPLFILEPNQEKAHGIKYRDLHYHYKEGVRTGDYVDVTLGSGENAFPLPPDIYRLRADYLALLEEAGFTVQQVLEPTPKESWGPEWELERQYPPFVIIVAE